VSRDYQRSACYAWEARHVHSKDASNIPFEQAQFIVNYVWAKAGLTYPPQVRLLGKNATRFNAEATRIWIKIPEAGIRTTVLLHEIAHSMTSSAADDQRCDHHGPRFVGVFMKLLADHISTFGIDVLMQTAKAEGVEFNFDGPMHRVNDVT
jgi:hypothetical protein